MTLRERTLEGEIFHSPAVDGCVVVRPSDFLYETQLDAPLV